MVCDPVVRCLADAIAQAFRRNLSGGRIDYDVLRGQEVFVGLNL